MGKKANVLTLTPEERDYLETQTRSRTIQAQTVCRARILLLKAEGESIDSIAVNNPERNPSPVRRMEITF